MHTSDEELDVLLARVGRYFSAHKTVHHGSALSEGHLLLARALSEKGTMRMGEVATLLAVTRPAVSAMVAHLEQVGVVKREPDPADRRATVISLTELGRRTCAEMIAARNDIAGHYLGVLTECDKDDLARICNKLLRGFASGEATEPIVSTCKGK